jgi:hypothetical protein
VSSLSRGLPSCLAIPDNAESGQMSQNDGKSFLFIASMSSIAFVLDNRLEGPEHAEFEP